MSTRDVDISEHIRYTGLQGGTNKGVHVDWIVVVAAARRWPVCQAVFFVCNVLA